MHLVSFAIDHLVYHSLDASWCVRLSLCYSCFLRMSCAKRGQRPELPLNVHFLVNTVRPYQGQPTALLYPPYAPCQDKESLLSQKGQAKKRLQELTSLCERQRSQLAEAKLRVRELERLASAAEADTRLAEDQVREVSVSDWVRGVDKEFRFLCLSCAV